MSDSFVSSKTIYVYAGITFFCSLTAFAVMMVFYLEFQKLSPIVQLEQQLGFSALSNLALAFEVAVGSAGLLMVLSIFYALSPAVGYRKQVFFFFSFSVTTCAVLEIATGVLMVDFSAKHRTLYCEDPACNPVDTPFDSWQLEMIHTELAIFNECCHSNIDAFDAAQTAELPGLGYADIQLKATRVQVGATQPCQTAPSGALNASLTCDPVQAPGIINTISGLETVEGRLCTCIPDIGSGVSATTAKIQQLGTCSKLQNIDIPINANTLDIPSTFISLGFVLSQYPWYGDNKNRVNTVPLVASPGIPLPSANNKGFGCGLGFGKGFIWYSDLFYESTLLVTSYASLGYGSSMTVFALAAIAYVYIELNGGSDLQEMYEDYTYTTPPPPASAKMAVKKPLKKKPYVPSTESIVQAHVPQKRSRSRRRRRRKLPLARKVGKDGEIEREETEEEETVVPLTKEDLEEKIIRFYKKFEPSKLVNGRVDPSVLSFVLESGVDVFNQRLREKYGVDLDHDIKDIV